MKFSSDTADHMLGFLDLKDKLAFGKTNKRNAKHVKKHMKPKFYVDQIVWETAYMRTDINFYKVMKVCKKTVVIEAVYWHDEWIFPFQRRPIRCKMERHLLKPGLWKKPTRYYWGLACNTRWVFRAKDWADRDRRFY